MKISVISFGPVASKKNGYFVRVWWILKALSRMGDVVLLEFPEDFKSCSMQNLKVVRLRGNEKVNRTGLISKVSKRLLTFDIFHVLKFQIVSLIELIRFSRFIRESDIVFIESPLLIPAMLISKLFGRFVVLDTHCINELLAEKFKSLSFKAYIIRKMAWGILERLSIGLADVILVASDVERRYVVQRFGVSEARVLTVPNLPANIKEFKEAYDVDERSVVFVGDLEASHNADAAKFIVDVLSPMLPYIKFYVIGRNVGFKSTRNVKFLGFVKDIAEYIDRSAVCIAPLRVGAGTKTKILDYLSRGRIVLTTPEGFEGLERFEKFVWVSDVKEFGSNLRELLSEADVKIRKRIGKGVMAVFDREIRRFEGAIRHAVLWKGLNSRPKLERVERYG